MWSTNAVCQTISPPIAAQSIAVDFEAEFVHTSVSITDSRQLSICRAIFSPSARTKQWSITSKQFATMSKTTGSNCYRWQTLSTTIPSTFPHWWHPCGWITITIVRCNLSLPRTPVSDHRCRQTRGWQVWKRLTEYSQKTYSRIRSDKISTPAGKRWPLRLGTKYGYQPGTWKHLGLHRSSITHAQDDIQ